MDNIPNRFLRNKDFYLNDYDIIRKSIDEYYSLELKGTPHPWGSKYPDSVVTHWSREWEYPWAVINSEVEPSYKLLDCGCGGSPLIPYLTKKFGCIANGIDLNYGNDLVSNQNDYMSQGNKLCDLRKVLVDPIFFTDGKYTIQKGSMDSMPYDTGHFDRVFCISVIEHLQSEDMGKECIKEMVRVLKSGGRMLITMDHTSYKDHVMQWCIGNYRKIIEWSGLELMGDSDFTVPSEDEIDGYYHVLGFVLKK